MDESVTYTVTIHDEGEDGLWAEVAELPGCFASGQDIEELNESLADAMGLYLSSEQSPLRVELRGEPVQKESVVEQRVAVC